MSIQLILFTVIAWGFWLTHYFRKLKLLKVSFICIITIFAFIISCFAFGPAESCGFEIPRLKTDIDTSYELTHAGYQYGAMDYGSRFILYKNKYGMEKIIGIADNSNYYYNHIEKLNPNIKKNKIAIKYYDDDEKLKTDTLDFTNYKWQY